MKSEFMRSRSRGASGSNSCSQVEKWSRSQQIDKGLCEGLGTHPGCPASHAPSRYRSRDVQPTAEAQHRARPGTHCLTCSWVSPSNPGCQSARGSDCRPACLSEGQAHHHPSKSTVLHESTLQSQALGNSAIKKTPHLHAFYHDVWKPCLPAHRLPTWAVQPQNRFRPWSGLKCTPQGVLLVTTPAASYLFN